MQALKAFYVQALVAALALCVVQQGHQVRHVGYRLEELRQQIRSSQVEIQKHKAQISRLKSPQRIVHLVEALGLDLAQPSVVRRQADADGDVPEAAVAASDRTYP